MQQRRLLLIIAILMFHGQVQAAPPERIVSLSPSVTREICELGQQHRLVGVATHERIGLKTTVVGNLQDISVEQVLALKPDLVLASKDANERRDIDTLRGLGLRVEVFEACESLASMNLEFLRLADMLGQRPQAAAIVKRVMREIDMPPLNSKTRVLWLVGTDPLITVNDATFTAAFIKKAGGVNIFGDLTTRYPCVNLEEILARRPEVVIVVKGHGNRLDLSNLKDLPAVRSGRIYYINADTVCQPTPLQFLKGCRQVRATLAAKSRPRSDSPVHSTAR